MRLFPTVVSLVFLSGAIAYGLPADARGGLGGLRAKDFIIKKDQAPAKASTSSKPAPVAKPVKAEANPVQKPDPVAESKPLPVKQPTAAFGDLPQELRAPQSTPGQIKAISRNRLVALARENSGREDPFVRLVNPPHYGYPPVPVMPGESSFGSLPNVPGRPRTIRLENGLVIPAPGLAGGLDQGAADSQAPNWQVNGILNTGRDALALLELNGVHREAKVGEVLEDGTQVVKIESSQVILQKWGRRYAKPIGGSDERNE